MSIVLRFFDTFQAYVDGVYTSIRRVENLSDLRHDLSKSVLAPSTAGTPTPLPQPTPARRRQGGGSRPPRSSSAKKTTQLATTPRSALLRTPRANRRRLRLDE